MFVIFWIILFTHSNNQNTFLIIVFFSCVVATKRYLFLKRWGLTLSFLLIWRNSRANMIAKFFKPSCNNQQNAMQDSPWAATASSWQIERLLWKSWDRSAVSSQLTGINVVAMNMLLSLTTLNGSSPWPSQIRCGAVMWPVSGRVSAGRTSPLFPTCSQENQWAGPCRSRRTAGSPWKCWKCHGKPVVSPAGWCSTASRAVIIRAGSSGSYCIDTGAEYKPAWKMRG